jgi:hypothetical protein
MPRWWSGCWWFGGCEGDVLAEAFELCDEASDVDLVGQAAGEVVPAEVGVGLAPVE